MKRWISGAMVCVALGCASAPFRDVPLNSSGRDLPELFLGGWDGHRLSLFDDTSLEPGVSKYKDVVQALSGLTGEQYGALLLLSNQVKPLEATHGVFCQTVACIVVFARNGGDTVDKWGRAEAVFELNGTGSEPMGSVWIEEKAIRAPGPRKWPALCRAKNDQPRHVHEDGGAIFPAQTVGKAQFAVFGPQELPSQYQSTGTRAPSDETCDDDLARALREPQPERPKIKADPALLQKLK